MNEAMLSEVIVGRQAEHNPFNFSEKGCLLEQWC